jgi:hypothetical protein
MIADSAAITFSSPTQISKTLRPVAAVSIYGIVFDYGTDGTEPPRLLAVDSKNGYLLAIDPLTQNTQILNAQHWQEFVGAMGLAIAGEENRVTPANKMRILLRFFIVINELI